MGYCISMNDVRDFIDAISNTKIISNGGNVIQKLWIGNPLVDFELQYSLSNYGNIGDIKIY